MITIRCQKCNNDITDNAEFCTNCGAKIEKDNISDRQESHVNNDTTLPPATVETNNNIIRLIMHKSVRKFIPYITGILLIIVLSLFARIPVLFIISSGIVMLCTCFLISSVKKSKFSDKKKARNIKVVLLSITIFIFTIIALISFPSPASGPQREYFDTVLMENVEFDGINENSIPLGASELKLIQDGYRLGNNTYYTYTLTGMLKKNSNEPSESIFEFTIGLLDEFGRSIITESTFGVPSIKGAEIESLFTADSTKHFEFSLFTSSEEQPAVVRFSEIKEVSREEFIRITLIQAEESLYNQYFDEARRLVGLVLSLDQNNSDADELLEQIIALEDEYNESQKIEVTPTPEITPTTTPDVTPNVSPSPSPTPSPDTVQITFSQQSALRAAVVGFTNFYAYDIYTDDGSEIDPSRLHSFADISGDLSEYFMFVLSEGTWVVKDENTWSVVGLRLERYTKLVRGEYSNAVFLSIDIIVNASLDISYDGTNFTLSNISGRTTLDDDISWWESDAWTVREFLMISPRLIEEDRDADIVSALDRRGNRNTDISIAERAFMNVGEELFPYGFDVDWRRGVDERIQAHDGSWYLRVNATITNVFNASRTATVEAIINFTTDRVEDFIVDGVIIF